MTSKTFSFTKGNIAALPPAAPGKREMYYDERVPHLAVRVTDTGSKTFLIYKWSDGAPIKRVIGKFPQVRVEQARQAATEISVALNSGSDPLELRKSKREEISLGNLFDRYFELYAQDRCNTANDMRANFTRYFGDWFSRPRWAPSPSKSRP